MSGLPTQLSKIKTRLKEAGNVLFMILIAVALFAALAYTVTNSTRSTGGDATREQKILDASRMVQHSNEIENGIMRMRLSNGCTDTQISFENPILDTYTNPNAPSDKRCHVFDPAGGNISYQVFFPTAAIGESRKGFGFVGANDIPQIGLSGCGDNCVDLIIFLWLQDRELCTALNIAESNPSFNPLQTRSPLLAPTPFIGTYTYVATGIHASFYGKRGGCYIWSGDTAWQIYYHILIAR